MIDISFDTSELVEQADRIAMLDSTTLAEMRLDAVNVVSLTVREKSIAQTHAELNLSRDYIETRIARAEAKGATARARITSEVRGATLQRFTGARQAVQPVKYTNSEILAKLGKSSFVNGALIGPRTVLPNGVASRVWTERRGDPSRGIEADKKAAGFTVDVNRKGAKTIRTAFTIPLKNNNGLGVFQRPAGGGDAKHLYGPSVYQVFRRYIKTNEQAIADTLRDEFVGRLDTKIQEILK